jgi:DNA-binding FadR family transcriptional regulator
MSPDNGADALPSTNGELAELPALTPQLQRRPEKISEAVARAIAHDIAMQGLPVGAVLPSGAAMLQRYRVGRAALREGLRILELHGLITVKPGPSGGAIVAKANSQDFGRMSTLHYQAIGATFRELLEARMFIEPLMAGLAAQEQDEELLSQLRQVAERTSSGLGNDVEYGYYSSEFHAVLASASGNRVLGLFTRSLKDVYAERVPGAPFPLEERRRVERDHDGILKAIESGNGRRAELLMRRHMERVAEFVSERFPGALDEVVRWH